MKKYHLTQKLIFPIVQFLPQSFWHWYCVDLVSYAVVAKQQNNICKSKTKSDVYPEVRKQIITVTQFFSTFEIRKKLPVLQTFWYQNSQTEKNETSKKYSFKKFTWIDIFSKFWQYCTSSTISWKRYETFKSFIRMILGKPTVWN